MPRALTSCGTLISVPPPGCPFHGRTNHEHFSRTRTNALSHQPFLRRPNQALRRNAQLFVQPPHHPQGERTFAIEDFVHAVQAADHGHEILGREGDLLHGEVFALVGFDQGDDYVEAVAFWRIRARAVISDSISFKAAR